jgi:ABC-type antimicrobial peptide transport system permease subunit
LARKRAGILLKVLRDAGVLVALGLVMGIAISLEGAQSLRSLVFGIAPRDPLTLFLASSLLLLTGFLAAWLPARRAAATEPMQALRTE